MVIYLKYCYTQVYKFITQESILAGFLLFTEVVITKLGILCTGMNFIRVLEFYIIYCTKKNVRFQKNTFPFPDHT